MMKLSTRMTWTPIGLWISLALCAPSSNATILGVLGNNTYSINEITAADVLLSTNSGPVLQAKSMAKNSAGVIYIAGGAGSSRLSTVDPVTGIITPGPNISLDADVSGGIQGLAFNSADVPYAINNPVPLQSNPPFKLYTIDPATGLGTFIGLVNGVISALEFSPSGTLCAWEVGTGLGLVTINPATGAITDRRAVYACRPGALARQQMRCG